MKEPGYMKALSAGTKNPGAKKITVGSTSATSINVTNKLRSNKGDAGGKSC